MIINFRNGGGGTPVPPTPTGHDLIIYSQCSNEINVSLDDGRDTYIAPDGIASFDNVPNSMGIALNDPYGYYPNGFEYSYDNASWNTGNSATMQDSNTNLYVRGNPHFNFSHPSGAQLDDNSVYVYSDTALQHTENTIMVHWFRIINIDGTSYSQELGYGECFTQYEDASEVLVCLPEEYVFEEGYKYSFVIPEDSFTNAFGQTNYEYSASVTPARLSYLTVHNMSSEHQVSVNGDTISSRSEKTYEFNVGDEVSIYVQDVIGLLYTYEDYGDWNHEPNEFIYHADTQGDVDIWVREHFDHGVNLTVHWVNDGNYNGFNVDLDYGISRYVGNGIETVTWSNLKPGFGSIFWNPENGSNTFLAAGEDPEVNPETEWVEGISPMPMIEGEVELWIKNA